MESDIMDKITDFLDDHSIITYKWLSKEIGVDFQKAKLLLKQYLDTHGSKEEIHATYCIIGSEKNEKLINRKAVVVRGCDVDKIKSRMDSNCSQHVYSVQKVELKNSTALYSIDLEINKHTFQIKPISPEITPIIQHVASPVRPKSPVKTTTTENEIKDVKEKKQTKKEETKNKQNARNVKAEKSSFFANNKAKKTPPAKKEAVAMEIDVPKRSRPSAIKKNGKTYQRIKRPRIESSSSGGESEADEDDENRDFFKLENVESEKSTLKEPEQLPVPEEPKPAAFVTKQETVNETFVDDDGYLVTKKTVKRTTEPAKPADIKNQTKPKPKPTQKKALATKRNAQQPTLTSFFKRN